MTVSYSVEMTKDTIKVNDGELSVPEANKGEKPGEVTTTGTGYSVDTKWYEGNSTEELGAGAVFEAGKSYIVKATLTVNDAESSKFDDTSKPKKIKVGGTEVDLTDSQVSVSEDGKSMTVSYSVTMTKDTIKVNDGELSVPGATEKGKPGEVTTTGTGYSVATKWYEGNSDQELGAGAVFEAGKSYTVKATLTVENETSSKFDDTSKPKKIKIGETEVELTDDQVSVLEDGKSLTVSYTFSVSHTYGEWIKEVSATCEKAGVKGHYHCKVCGKDFDANKNEIKDLQIPATGHTIVSEKTKEPTAKEEGEIVHKCNKCGHIEETFILPQTEISVYMGKTANLISDASTSNCSITLANAKKYKKYFTLDTKTGKIKTSTKKLSKVKIKKTIPVKVTVDGKAYNVNVKLKIAAPKITIKRSSMKIGGIEGYRYKFKYNIKGAKKIRVRVKNMKTLNAACNKYLTKPRNNSQSFLNVRKSSVKGKKLIFEIVAYYGKNTSEAEIIKK